MGHLPSYKEAHSRSHAPGADLAEQTGPDLVSWDGSRFSNNPRRDQQINFTWDEDDEGRKAHHMTLELTHQPEFCTFHRLRGRLTAAWTMDPPVMRHHKNLVVQSRQANILCSHRLDAHLRSARMPASAIFTSSQEAHATHVANRAKCQGH